MLKLTQPQPNRAPRTDRRRQRTRSAIIAAGQQLFATRPIEGVSIDDIVAAADVAKGSFYNHFDDKEGLAATIVELVQGDSEHHIYVANQDITDAAARVARALAVTVRYAHDHPDRLQALLSLSTRRGAVNAPINAGVTHDIRQGLETGRFKGVPPESGVLIVIGLISVAVDFLSSPEAATPPTQVVAEMGAALLRALGLETDQALRVAAEASELLPEWEDRP
jgi:AcrR family transcriptional regulator